MLENPDDPSFDFSASSIGTIDTETIFWKKFRICRISTFKNITLKNLEFWQYKVLIFVCILLSSVTLVIEVFYLINLTKHHDVSEINASLIPLLVTILSGCNIMLLVKLIKKPTTKTTLISLSIMLILMVAYIVQTIISYAGNENKHSIELTATIVFIVIQFFSAVMLYRFWEMILYNYDDTTVDTCSGRNTLTSNFGSKIDVRDLENSHSNNPMGSGHHNTQLQTALTSAAHMRDMDCEAILATSSMSSGDGISLRLPESSSSPVTGVR